MIVITTAITPSLKASSRPRLIGSAQERRGRDSRRAMDPFEEKRDLIDVAPAPVLAGLEGADDRVRRALGVLAGVPVRGVVAAADVTAGETDPKMELPPSVDGCEDCLRTGGKWLSSTSIWSRWVQSSLIRRASRRSQ